MDRDIAAVEREAEQLRRERDELAARIASLESRRPTQGRARVRRGAVAVLVVLGVAAFTASSLGWWARRNVANTEVWMDRVGPLAEDPAVQEALGTWLTGEVVELVDPASLFKEVLPERGQLLATPLASAVEDFVHTRIDRFLASDRFETLWVAANEQAHRAVVRVLRDESEAVQAEGDRVVINLVPVINAALADVGDASPELLGREIDLPNLSVDDLPDAAIARLEGALGISLDDDFGQFTVYDRGRLSALQDGIERARRWLYLLSATTVVTLAAALWFSPARRRTLLQILVGLALGLALIRRLGLRGQRELLDAIPDAVNRAAATAATDAFLDPLLAVTQTLLIGLACAVVVAVLTGPYPWVVRKRSRVIDTVRKVDSSWVNTHQRELGSAAVGLALLVLLVADLSFLGVVLVGAVAAGGGLVLRRTRTPRPGETG